MSGEIVSQTPFFKLSGGGNDFIALAKPEHDPEPHEIRALCHRGVSLGADGLFVLRPDVGGVRMDHWNADGNPAELCLNGTRCAARLARHLGWAEGLVVIITPSGRILAHPSGPNTITLDVPLPAAAPEELNIRLDSGTWQGWRTRIGVPHFVLLWPESLANAPVGELGSVLRHSPEFPDGTNVMFVRYPVPDVPGQSTLEIRSFERGVEAETLACGSGILAATFVGLHLGRLSFPIDVVTLGGFPFNVTGSAPDGQLISWSLTGDARLLAVGELQEAAVSEPEPPRWSA
jgi:diaminopimelate epimerase